MVSILLAKWSVYEVNDIIIMIFDNNNDNDKQHILHTTLDK